MPNARLDVEVGRRPGRRRRLPASAPTPAAAACRWPRWRRAASWPAPCWPCAWSSPTAPPTLVFDEVDAGIGGTTALAVGRRAGRARATTTRCWWSPTCPRWRPSPTPRCASRRQVDGRAHGHRGPPGRRRRAGRRAVADAVGPARLGHGPRARRRAAGRGRGPPRRAVTVLVGFLAGLRRAGTGGWLMLRPTFAGADLRPGEPPGRPRPHRRRASSLPLAVLASETALPGGRVAGLGAQRGHRRPAGRRC